MKRIEQLVHGSSNARDVQVVNPVIGSGGVYESNNASTSPGDGGNDAGADHSSA